MKIILASSSIYRQGLLNDVGLSVDICAPDVDETPIVGETPIQTAEMRADAKALAVANQFPTALVIGADQVCYLDGVLMGKPQSENEWLDRLQKMRGKTHHLTTAVSLVSLEQNIHRKFYETTNILFRSDLTDSELRAYVEDGEAKKCAGGYMMERKGAWMIERIEGDWQNVIGLPIFPLLRELKDLKVSSMEDVLK